MNPLTRLIKAIDDNLAHSIDRHIETAIPAQRSSSPEQVTRHLTPVGQRLQIEVFACCTCCSAYEPQPCPAIHRDRCDLHQQDGA